MSTLPTTVNCKPSFKEIPQSSALDCLSGDDNVFHEKLDQATFNIPTPTKNGLTGRLDDPSSLHQQTIVLTIEM